MSEIVNTPKRLIELIDLHLGGFPLDFLAVPGCEGTYIQINRVRSSSPKSVAVPVEPVVVVKVDAPAPTPEPAAVEKPKKKLWQKRGR